MNYKDYKSFEIKNGVIDVFSYELDTRTVVQLFITDYVSGATSSATFTNIETFERFIEFLKTMKR